MQLDPWVAHAPSRVGIGTLADSVLFLPLSVREFKHRRLRRGRAERLGVAGEFLPLPGQRSQAVPLFCLLRVGRQVREVELNEGMKVERAPHP